MKDAMTKYAQRIMSVLEQLYGLVFQDRMGPGTRTFVKNLSYVSTGTLAASGLIFLSLVYIGRRLGPAEYGKYNLIIALSNFLLIWMLAGFHIAAVKYLAEDQDRKKEIISTAFSMVVAFTLIDTGIFYALSWLLARALQIELYLFRYAILVSAVLALYYIMDAFLRGLHEMLRLSLLRVVLGVAFALALFLLLLRGDRSFLTPTWATVVSYLVYIAWAIGRIRTYLSFTFNKEELRRVLRYGFYAVVGTAAGSVISDVDKLIINRYLSTDQVGVYSAYMLGANIIAVKGASMFVTVFFPTVSAYKDKVPITEKIQKMSQRTFLLLFALSFLIILSTMKSFGSKYPLNYLLVLLLALYTPLTFLSSARLWFLASFGERNIKATSLTSAAAALLISSANLLLVPRFGLYGAVSAGLLTSAFMFLASAVLLKRTQTG
jgi:O-antigen/teichoic acid export membrane protein